jgi:hypothetical protein
LHHSTGVGLADRTMFEAGAAALAVADAVRAVDGAVGAIGEGAAEATGGATAVVVSGFGVGAGSLLQAASTRVGKTTKCRGALRR